MGPPISGCPANPRPHDFPAREALALGTLLSLRHSYPRECLHSPRPCTPLDLDPPSVHLVFGTPTCLVTLLSPLTPDSCNPPPPAARHVLFLPLQHPCSLHRGAARSLNPLSCPAGVNRHFHMICIRDKFSQNIGRQVPSKVIWDHLSTMYDMQALHESEILPFPNPERNFVLPDEIIQEVREGKVVIEEEMKEEMKEDVDPHSGADDAILPAPVLPRGAEHRHLSPRWPQRCSSAASPHCLFSGPWVNVTIQQRC
uniref:MRG/MORF4L-binding protein isoform X2 n=1 Tax=Myodes glareolus TaxID=447135 RepID=UPI002020C4DD|nr:MRG/MORF4L-binding protein isoform X2 [Myodes glareolus]